jgi:hypothetical protein
MEGILERYNAAWQSIARALKAEDQRALQKATEDFVEVLGNASEDEVRRIVLHDTLIEGTSAALKRTERETRALQIICSIITKKQPNQEVRQEGLENLMGHFKAVYRENL